MSPLARLESQAMQGDYFHAFFRERGLHLRRLYLEDNLDLQQATSIPPEVTPPAGLNNTIRENTEYLKNHFLQLLMSPASAEILWSLYCLPSQETQSTLGQLSPSLEALARVVRGGPNIYKMNGWLVHVLIGYSMVTSFIPKGELPQTIEWDAEVRKFCARNLRTSYRSLDSSSRVILHVAMLGHDIGVAKGIKDHDKKGVPLVPRYLSELNITPGALNDFTPDVSLEDFTWAVEAIVRHHTMINRIGVEFSVERSRKELAKLEGSADSDWRRTFLKDRLPSILMLVGVADLIAVDDALLSSRKVEEILDGARLMKSVLEPSSMPLDAEAEGFERFKHFLNDRIYDVAKEAMDESILNLGIRPLEYWAYFRYLEEFNFALSFARGLTRINDVLLLFATTFRFVNESIGSSTALYRETRVVFSPKLESEWFASRTDQLTPLPDFGSPEDHHGSDVTRLGPLFFKVTRDHGYLVSVAADSDFDR